MNVSPNLCKAMNKVTTLIIHILVGGRGKDSNIYVLMIPGFFWVQSKEVNKEKAKGHGLQYITKGAPPSNQSGVSVQEETSIHTGGKKNGGFASSGTVGGVVTGRAPEAVNFVQDIGNSSNDKASGFEAGGACFTSNSLLAAEQMCGGVSSISANDLPDLQAPGSDETEADLLFTMPTNMMTFQDTVLLQQPVWSKIKENDTYQVLVNLITSFLSQNVLSLAVFNVSVVNDSCALG
jgi:hypothetical protein